MYKKSTTSQRKVTQIHIEHTNQNCTPWALLSAFSNRKGLTSDFEILVLLLLVYQVRLSCTFYYKEVYVH